MSEPSTCKTFYSTYLSFTANNESERYVLDSHAAKVCISYVYVVTNTRQADAASRTSGIFTIYLP